jgi:hypothetical protein
VETRVRARAEHIGFVVDKVALVQVFPSTSVSSAKHYSTNFPINTITRDWHNRPINGRSAEWTQLDSTIHYSNLKKKLISTAAACVRSQAGSCGVFILIPPTDPYPLVIKSSTLYSLDTDSIFKRQT